MAIHINTLNGGDITITTESAARAVTRIWWSNDEYDYSDCPSNNGSFDESCFPEGKYNWDALKVEFGSDVTNIGYEAFSDCDGLTSVTIPEGVTSIGDSAFYNCSGLTSVTIPTGVTNIEYCAFRYCSGLTSMTIPNSVVSIGEFAFHGCSGLTSVTFLGKTMQEVQDIEDGYGNKYCPFGLDFANENGVTIHCSDGDIPISYEG